MARCLDPRGLGGGGRKTVVVVVGHMIREPPPPPRNRRCLESTFGKQRTLSPNVNEDAAICRESQGMQAENVADEPFCMYVWGEVGKGKEKRVLEW